MGWGHHSGDITKETEEREMNVCEEKKPAMTYQQSVWFSAVKDAEQSVIRNCCTPSGGKRADETVEQYAERCIGILRDSLKTLAAARKELAAAKRSK